MVDGKGQTEIFAVIVRPGRIFKIFNQALTNQKEVSFKQLVQPVGYRPVLGHPSLKTSRDFKNRVKKMAELVEKKTKTKN